MTDRQDKPTCELPPPSRLTVWLYGVASALAFCGSIWAGLGHADDSHELAGLALGLFATALLVCETIATANARTRVWVRQLNEHNDNTGVWESPDGAKRFTVRWDLGEQAYYVQGHLGGYLFYPDEQRWPQKGKLLTEVVRGLEHIDAWCWVDDLATRAVRARLGLAMDPEQLMSWPPEGWNNSRGRPGPY